MVATPLEILSKIHLIKQPIHFALFQKRGKLFSHFRITNEMRRIFFNHLSQQQKAIERTDGTQMLFHRTLWKAIFQTLHHPVSNNVGIQRFPLQICIDIPEKVLELFQCVAICFYRPQRVAFIRG